MSAVSLKASPASADEAWLRRFHAGERAVLAHVYEEHFDTVSAAAGALVSGADRETVVHEVFYRLVESATARASFQGGSLGAWLAVSARRQALDLLRSRNREGAAVQQLEAEPARHGLDAERLERQLEAQRQVARFRRDVLPAKWAPVFEAIFLRGLSQREAAADLGMSRTTLAYQELRVRHLLRHHFLTPEGP